MRMKKSMLFSAVWLLMISAIAAPRANISTGALTSNTLCAREERVIFSCVLRRPARMVSVCASKDLTNDKGYLQYRFGLPGKLELEFPKKRVNTQQQFEYSHYFRARVDLTEINFTVD